VENKNIGVGIIQIVLVKRCGLMKKYLQKSNKYALKIFFLLSTAFGLTNLDANIFI
jgi:hypothetical protein